MMEHVERFTKEGKRLYKEYAPFRVKLKDGVSGDWKVDHFNVEVDLQYARLAFDNRSPGLGKFTRLTRNNQTIMSDTAAEVRDLIQYLHRLKGDILITGLGLGMTVHALTSIEKYSKDVKSILVVEKSPDVFKLTAHAYRDPRVLIVNEDALTYKPDRNIYKFDAAWHDIWDDISIENNFGEMRRHWGTYMKGPNSQFCWGEADAKARERRYG